MKKSRFLLFYGGIEKGIHMKRQFTMAFVAAVSIFMLTGCLTINQKDILPAPYMPEIREDAAAESVLYLFDGEIDWNRVDGVYALKLSHGLGYDSSNAEAYFQIASDNVDFYARVTVKDDVVLSTDSAPSLAWDSDSVELFIGRDTRRHTSFDKTDHMLRVNLKEDGTGQMGLDDELYTGGTVSYEITDDGYIVTLSVPFTDLNWDELEDGDVIRAEYALNDADSLSREHKLQWTGDDDLAYADASKWGSVRVEEVR